MKTVAGSDVGAGPEMRRGDDKTDGAHTAADRL